MSLHRIEQIKQAFSMKPHPEGGFYSEQYRANTQVSSPLNGKKRPTMTHIYFLLTQNDISRWHRVVHDEIWNVYEGDPLRILTLKENNTDGYAIDDCIIGDIGRTVGSEYYKLIEGGDYQAAETTGLYTLVGCTVAPGFEFEDFSYIECQPLKHFVASIGKDYTKFL
jgi:predicted cupin superfamily sugar epimerase